MKFSCNPTELSDALNIVSRAIPMKVSIPVLEGIKILAEGDTLTLSATDMELYIEKKIKATIRIEGETVVLGKLFTDFIKKLTDIDQIDIEKGEDKLIVKYGTNEGKIQCLNEDTYPEITQVDDDKCIKIKETELKKLLDRSAFCYAMDDSRPILKGVLLEVSEDKTLTAVALDGFRIAICKATINENKGSIRIVIPGKNLTEISKIFTDTDDEVVINIQRNNIMFDLKHTRVTTRLMEGDYIQYEKIVPTTITSTIVVNKDVFESGLDRATLIGRNVKSNYVKLTISSNQITFRSTGEEGSIVEEIPCTLDGKEMEVGFNSKYLFDALNRITEDYIRLDMNGSNVPVSINPLEGNSFKYIVLPVRLIG